MRTSRATIALAAAGLLTAIAVSGCEDPDAKARTAAQVAIEEATVDYRELMLLRIGPDSQDLESHKSKLSALGRTLSGISEADKGQKVAIDMLQAATSRELARLTLEEATLLERQLRAERRLLQHRIDAATRLLSLANGRSSVDFSTSRAVLDTARSEVIDARQDESDKMADLDGPISSLSEDNRDDGEEVQRLMAESNSLRRDAAELGDADGQVTFEEAVDRQRAADVIETRIANRELNLDYDLRPEHRLAQARVDTATDMIAAIDRSMQELEDFVASSSEDVGKTQQAVEALVAAIQAELDSIGQQSTSLDELYAIVVSELEKAAGSANRVASGSGGSRADAVVAQARIAAQLGETRWWQLRGLSDHARLLTRLSESGADLAAGSYDDQLDAVNTRRDESREQARAAYNDAKSYLASANQSSAPVRSFTTSVDAALAALGGGDGEIALSLPEVNTSDPTP